MPAVSCSACGAPIEPTDMQAPCPRCGSADRHVYSTDRIALILYQKTHVKQRRGGEGKPAREEVRGDDFRRSTGQWLHLSRTIDRANDQYSEEVIDPRTGEIVHQCEEALSAHRGHGSAKRRQS